jgi:hypothetical protein
VAYTSISTYEPRGYLGWRATTADGVLLELSNAGGTWHGRWPNGPSIKIPGARDLKVRECLWGWTQTKQKLGVHYILVTRELTNRLLPLEAWCRENAEMSIVGGYFWIESTVWAAQRDDNLAMPFIPELDEPGEDLQEVARSERECREAHIRLETAQTARAHALIAAAARHRSRRRLAQAAGLSFARIQQIIRSNG